MLTMEEQPLDFAAYIKGHKAMAYIQRSLAVIAFSWFLRLHVSYKIDWSAFVQACKKNKFRQRKSHKMHKLKLMFSRKTKL